jgi:hypothetical protein
VKSVLAWLFSRAETAHGEGISQEIVTRDRQRRGRSRQQIAPDRTCSRPGDAVLSTAPLRVCLFDADNSGGPRQFNWLWWTALVSISAEEGPRELVHQS